jgi:hypothetical protein
VQPSSDLARKITAYTFASTLVITGLLGNLVLLVATANPLGLAAFALVDWPGTIVVLILSLCGIGALEGGLALIRRPDAGTADQSPIGQLFSALMGIVTVVVILAVFAVGLGWALSQIQTGLEPTAETYVVAGTFGLYAVLRIVLTLSGVRGGELARAVGIEPAVPDPGETGTRFALRLLLGMLVGIPLLDTLIVFVGVALAPNDRRIYPTPSDTTLVAALLWFIGIAAAGSGVAGYVRGRATARKLLVYGIVAVTTLLPALVLDARVPLYPFIAGIF